MTTFTCEICGKSFDARRAAKYCGVACKQLAYRLRNGSTSDKVDSVAHSEAMKARAAKAQRTKERTEIVRYCVHCQKPFKVMANASVKLYCSADCKRRASAERQFATQCSKWFDGKARAYVGLLVRSPQQALWIDDTKRQAFVLHFGFQSAFSYQRAVAIRHMIEIGSGAVKGLRIVEHAITDVDWHGHSRYQILADNRK